MTEHDMTYESARAAFSLEIPDSFNFGFDQVGGVHHRYERLAA